MGLKRGRRVSSAKIGSANAIAVKARALGATQKGTTRLQPPLICSSVGSLFAQLPATAVAVAVTPPATIVGLLYEAMVAALQ